jgi:bifunctional DNase/RNase
MIEVELNAVRVDLRSNTPVLLLQEIASPRRTLPIFIGAPEATSIAIAIQGIQAPRPLTHDLIKNLIESLECKLINVIITELQDSTYYAELTINRGERTFKVSSRPSDAIAVAIRMPVPIFVAEDLLNNEGISVEVLDADREDTFADENPDELVGEFKQFLDNLRPEDFSG